MEALTRSQLNDFDRVMNRLLVSGVRFTFAGMKTWGEEMVDVQLVSDDARADMAKVAHLMRHARKDVDSNYYLMGEIEGVTVRAYTGQEAVCKIVEWEEVEVPAQPAKPARTEKRPVFDCTEPILAARTHPVSQGVADAEAQAAPAEES